MSIENNKTIARRLYEDVVNHGRFDLLDEFLAPDATRQQRGSTLSRESFSAHVIDLRENVGDLRTSVTDLIAEGDKVVVYWRIQGIHQGTVFGVPGTGNEIDGTSISLVTFRDGQVVDYQVQPDRLTILQQLGALPV